MTAFTTLQHDGALRGGFGRRRLAPSWSALAGARGENVCPVAIRIAGEEDRDAQMTRVQSGRKLAAGYRQPRVKTNGAGAVWSGGTP